MARVIAQNGEEVALKAGQSTLVQKFLSQSGQGKFATGDDVRRFLQQYEGRKPYACDFSHLNPALERRAALHQPSAIAV